MKSFRLLKAAEIECRVNMVKKNGVSLLLYKDARCDQNILDEVVGPSRWQRKHELIDGKLFCSVGIRFEREDGTSEWVWKQDVGTESYTEKEKGQASDSFKRACVNWGIGRELYSAPFIWVTDVELTPKGNGLTCYDSFAVKHIAYNEDETISELEIINTKKGNTVYTYGMKGRKATSSAKKGTAAKQAAPAQQAAAMPQAAPDDRTITNEERQGFMQAIADRYGDNDTRNRVFKDVIGRLGLRSSAAMTVTQLGQAMEILKQIA